MCPHTDMFEPQARLLTMCPHTDMFEPQAQLLTMCQHHWALGRIHGKAMCIFIVRVPLLWFTFKNYIIAKMINGSYFLG